MAEAYGSRPEEITVLIGPCICGACYQVGDEVASEVRKVFPAAEIPEFLQPDSEGRYRLDLSLANACQMKKAGVRPEKIVLPDLCTRCTEKLLYSHRAAPGPHGILCAFLMVRP